ncbi:hypothetical protein ACFL08_01045 [Patescibacteria group bacterium]
MGRAIAFLVVSVFCMSWCAVALSQVSGRPDIDLIVKEIGLQCSASDDDIELRAREVLRSIISYHPNRKIRDNLNGLFDKGEIILVFDRLSGGAFEEWPAKKVKPIEGRFLDDSEVYPVMILNAHRLLCIETEKQILDFFLVIDHEYDHYKKWAIATQKESFRAMRGQGKELSQKACELIWDLERSAYLRNCQSVWDWGYEESSFSKGLCKNMGEKEFDSQLLLLFSTGKYRKIVECQKIWENIAMGGGS